MSGEPLVETLELDIQPALTALEPLGTALDGIITGFSTDLAAGITTSLGALAAFDTSGLTTSVETALTDAVATPVPIEGDVTALDTALADALDAPRAVPLDADTTPLAAAIADATDLPQTVPIDADVTAAKEAIGALAGESVDIPIVADTTQAQDAIDQLGTSASGATAGVDSLSGGVEALSATTGLAKGEIGELGGFISNIGPESAAAVTGLVAFGAFLGETANLAADAQAQNRRFAETFGLLADQVRQINVGGLTISLEDLGRESGTTNADLEATASRIGQLGKSSNASGPTIADTTDKLLALGATVAVNNPRLGDAATVTDGLTAALARGGRALTPFGISLTSAQINTEALRETGKATAAELTIFEKATAGANLATQQFGDTLGTKFQEGAQNAQVEFRALKVQLEEVLVAVGGPLLDPLVTSLQDVLPVAEETGVALGKLAQAVLPVVAALGPGLAPIAATIGAVGDGITVLDDAAKALLADASPAKLAILAGGIGAIALESGILTTAVFELGLALDTNPIFAGATVALGALALLGASFGLLHHSAETLTVDGKDLASALNESGVATDVLAGKSVHLTDALSKQFETTLAAGTAGQTAQDGAAQLGLSYSTLATILTSTTSKFSEFTTNLLLNVHGTEQEQLAQLKLEETLQSTRDALAAYDKSALDAAVSQGLLTQAQVDAAAGNSEALFGADELITVYQKLKPTIDAATEAQRKHNLEQSTTSGRLRETISAFDPATGAVATYTAALVALGVTQSDADALAKDQVASLQETRDKTILASQAVRALDLAFVTGRLSAGQLEGGVFGLGSSLKAAQGEASRLTGEIDSFAKSATSALPGAGSAVQSFSSGVVSAFQNVATAASKGPAEVAAAQAALVRALDPTTFVASLNAEAAAIAGFQANLAKLVSEGLGALAGTLAQKGPEAGAVLAQGFVNDRTKAIAADGAVQLVTAATTNFTTFASGPEAAAAMGAAGTALATAANRGYAGSFALEHPTQTQLDAAKLLVTAAEPGLKGAAGGLAAAGVIAFDAEFGRFPTIAEIQAGKTRDALGAAAGGLSTAAQGAGSAATAGFAGGLDFTGATSGALTDSKGQYDPQHTIDIANSARAGGRVIGFQFDLGVASGITAGESHVTDAATIMAAAAEAAAKTRLGISSPSTVGIAIGANVVAAIAQGLGQVGPITDAVGGIAASLSKIEAVALHPLPEIVAPLSLDTTKAVAQLKNLATFKIPAVALAFYRPQSRPLTRCCGIRRGPGRDECSIDARVLRWGNGRRGWREEGSEREG